MGDRSSRPAPLAEPDPVSRWCARSCICGGSTGSVRSRSRARTGLAALDGAPGPGPLLAQPARRIDRVTGEPIRRYEHDHPGSLIHVDVTKFGNIPDGGGCASSAAPTRQAQPDSHRDRTGQRNKTYRHPQTGTAYCTPSSTTTPASPTPRSATDETTDTAIAVLATRPPGSPPAASPSSASCPTTAAATDPTLWRTPAPNWIKPKKTRPYRPQTNGKIERFHRTLADGWAFSPFYYSRHQPAAQPYPAWLHESTITTGPTAQSGNSAPINRLTNVPGQYT